MITYIKGKRIEISVYFAVMITFAFAVSPQGYAPAGLVCCILHETGHLIFMWLTGCRVSGISLGLYGMRIDCEPGFSLSYFKEMLIALGGPLVNIALMVVGLIFNNKMLVLPNAALAVFNLLPIESTDGHSVLKNLLNMHFDEEKTKAALRIVSAAFLFVLYFFGFFLFFKSRYNISALVVAIYLTIKFLFQGSQPCR